MLPEKTGAWIAQSFRQQCRRATGSGRLRRNALPQSIRPGPEPRTDECYSGRKGTRPMDQRSFGSVGNGKLARRTPSTYRSELRFLLLCLTHRLRHSALSPPPQRRRPPRPHPRQARRHPPNGRCRIANENQHLTETCPMVVYRD